MTSKVTDGNGNRYPKSINDFATESTFKFTRQSNQFKPFKNRYSEKDRATFISLSKEGLTVSQISKKLDVPYTSIKDIS